MKNTVLIFFLLPLVGIAQQNFNFMHDGMSRQYIYYSPANLAPDAPLVFVAHGYTGSAQGIMGYSGMNALADQKDLQSATHRAQWTSNNRFWNVGYDFTSNSTVDDVGFITSLATYLQTTYNLSTVNTFYWNV